MSVLLFL